MDREANDEEQQLINLLKINLGKFACFGINTLINEVIPSGTSLIHVSTTPSTPSSPSARSTSVPSSESGLRRRTTHGPHTYPDPGIRVTGVSGISDTSISASENDNINRSYVRDYIESSGSGYTFDKIEDHKARDGEPCCVICEDNASIIMFMPCNHISFCKQCATLLNECPLCKKHIDHKIRVFVG